MTQGGIFSGGALGLALNDWTSPPSCVAGNEGNLYYNSTTLAMEVCNGSTWTAAGSGGGGTLNTILAATAPGTLQDSGANPIIWNWNSLAGGNGLTLGSTSTAAAGNTQTLLNIALSGANATPALTTYAEQVSNAHTGAGTNVGLSVSASGGTNNYAAIFNAGNVGIGTTAPATPLVVVSTQPRLALSAFKIIRRQVTLTYTLMTYQVPIRAVLVTPIQAICLLQGP